MKRLILLTMLCLPAFAQDEEPLANDEPVPAEDSLLEEDASENPELSSAPEGEGAAKQTEAIQRAQPNPSQRRISEVVKHLDLFKRSQEVIKFSDDEASLSGLYLPENTGKPQGGILILHDIDQHAHWPSTIGPLREYLPDYGWNTLSLFFDGYIQPPLPKIPESQPPTTPNDTPLDKESESDTAEQALTEINAPLDPPSEDSLDDPIEESLEDENFASEDDTGGDELDNIAENDFSPFPIPSDEAEISADEETDPAEQFIVSMTERVEGGLRQLNTLGQFNLVVVAHGLSANWAANTLKSRFEQNPEAVGYALVLVNAKQSEYPEFSLNATLAQFRIPILDIHTYQEEHEIWLAIDRKNTIVREQKAKYMQIRLPSINTASRDKQNMITRRVRGWLKTHAAGEEVNVAEKRY